jgi:hypothetical protein
VSVPGVLWSAATALAIVGLALQVARPSLPRLGAAQMSPPLPARRSEATGPARPAADFHEIAAANVFSPTRAPPTVRFTPRGAAGPTVARAARPGPTLRLYGITVGDQGAIALIDGDARIPGAEIYRVGDLVAGASIVAITDSTVTIARPSGPLVLRLPPAQRRKP